jgi:hypothetical protein
VSVVGLVVLPVARFKTVLLVIVYRMVTLMQSVIVLDVEMGMVFLINARIQTHETLRNKSWLYPL